MKNIRIFIGLTLMMTTLGACQTKKKAKVTDDSPKTDPLTLLWASDTTLLTPESVLFDKGGNVLYVSCISGVPPTAKDGDGYIAKISPADGSVIKMDWVTGLDAPKGMGITNDMLYVTDIDKVVVIDLATGNVVSKVAIEGSQFLNDIAVDAEGNVYVSDSNTNKIYKMNGLDVALHLEGAFGGSNGLFADGNKLMVAGFQSGDFQEVTMADGSSRVVADSIFGGDGIEKAETAFLVSSWSGELYYVPSSGKKELLLDTKGTANAADIEFDAETKTVFVPTFFGNQVVAYKLSKK